MKVFVAAQRLGGGGGMERYLDIVLPALAASGDDVRAVAREIHPAAFAGAERVAWSDEHDPPSESAARACAAALAAFAPDVAVAHNVMDAAVLRVLRSAPRFVFQVHDHRPFCPNGDRLLPRTQAVCGARMGSACAVHALTDGCGYGARPRTLGLLARRGALRDAVCAADAVVATSPFMRAEAIRNGIPGAALVTVPLPLADDAYGDEPPAPGTRTVVGGGRLVPQKGFASLVDALARIPAAGRPHLRIFGDGPERAALAERARRRGVSFEAPGAVSPAALRAAIDACALVVVPSLWAEPFGYLGIEAFARGRTVVACNTGGVGAWLEHGRNGLAVGRGDVAGLARAVAALLDDDPQRARLAAQARRDAERFRAATLVPQLRRAYGGERPPARATIRA